MERSDTANPKSTIQNPKFNQVKKQYGLIQNVIMTTRINL